MDCTGDEIIAINGRLVSSLTKAEVLDLIQRQADCSRLNIIAQRHVMQRVNRYKCEAYTNYERPIHRVRLVAVPSYHWHNAQRDPLND